MNRERVVGLVMGGCVAGGVACLVAVASLAGPWVGAIAAVGCLLIAVAATEVG